MKPHKWEKEIKHWADGGEIEWRWKDQYKKEWNEWQLCTEPHFYYFNYEFRIKPQSKEPQYLYAYFDYKKLAINWSITGGNTGQGDYIGKIKLEQDDE